jgi:hypothetical protein
VLLQDLPAKAANRILRGATWTDVGFSHRRTTTLRSSIIRGAGLRRLFWKLAAIWLDITHGLSKRTDSSMMTDQLTGNGLRWGQRISVDIPVQVAAEGSPATHGYLRNISLSGALMEPDRELRLHAYIELSIEFSEARRSPARVMARVTRKFKDTVGVEWCEFAPSAVKDLLRSPSIQLPL